MAANTVAKRYAAAFPVTFGPTSAKVGDKLYAHEETAVIAAGANPVDGRYSAVVVAGLSAAAICCSSGVEAGRKAASASIASGNANCSPEKPYTKRPPRISPRASRRR